MNKRSIVDDARIIKIDWADKKIGLSLRDVTPLTEEEIAQRVAASAEPEDVTALAQGGQTADDASAHVEEPANPALEHEEAGASAPEDDPDSGS